MPTIVRHKGTTDRKACQAASESTADMTLHNYRVSDAVQSGWIAGTPLNRGVLSMQCGVGSGADSATDESIGSDEEGELRRFVRNRTVIQSDQSVVAMMKKVIWT